MGLQSPLKIFTLKMGTPYIVAITLKVVLYEMQYNRNNEMKNVPLLVVTENAPLKFSIKQKVQGQYRKLTLVNAGY